MLQPVVDDARAEYPAKFTRPTVSQGLREGIELLFPSLLEYAGRRKTALDMLGRRVSWQTVKHWRAGRRSMPPWAKAVLAQKAKEKAAALLHVAALLEDEKR